MKPAQSTASVKAQQPHSEMTRSEIVEFFKRRERAYKNFDAAALAADYADTAVIESPMAGTHVGPAAAEQAMHMVFEAFMNRRMEFGDLLVDGNHVVQVANIEGMNRGRFMGLPPTDKPFHVTAVFLYELDGRQIVRERRIYDFTGLLVQIGTLKAKPA